MKNRIPFLLEIGTEEIPARFFDAIIEPLHTLTADLFEKNRIDYADIRCIATPRRLTLKCTITSPIQKSVISEITGPPAKVAFDKDGNPTKAAEGFAHSQGVGVGNLKIKHTERGDYVTVIKEVKGKKVSKVLPTLLPHLILSLHFPKSMRWGYHTIRFARPIRWVLCLLEKSAVKFEIDGMMSGSYTYGHRLLSSARIPIQDPADYEKKLKQHHVVVDHIKRKNLIEKQIEDISRKAGGKPVKDEELINTVNFLTENPHAVLCTFPEQYLTLPHELLITVMRDHQKYFAITDTKGNLINSFIAISNTSRQNAKTVKAGAEKVIKARFEDARFYFSDDIKKTLGERIEDLKGITFHEGLGTLNDKVHRIKTVASDLCEKINPSKCENVILSAELCKSDLTTGVVREFPELQGIIGYYYAEGEHLPHDIALALKDHYKPLNASDTIPESDIGRIVSISDKIDNIAAFFSEGKIPSGSEDPFALRRQAQGIVQILLAVPYDISLKEIIDAGQKALTNRRSDITETLNLFFTHRVQFALSSLGHNDDIINSVLLESITTPLYTLQKKLHDLHTIKSSPNYNTFLLAVKRVKNILPPSPPEEIETELFSEDSEQLLYNEVCKVEKVIGDYLKAQDFQRAIGKVLSLTSSINSFFDNVLVMDKDERRRNNRLALLRKVWNMSMKICDFSKLSESEN